MFAVPSLLPTWGDRIAAIVGLAVLVWLVWFLFIGLPLLLRKPAPLMSVECSVFNRHQHCHTRSCECRCHYEDDAVPQ